MRQGGIVTIVQLLPMHIAYPEKFCWIFSRGHTCLLATPKKTGGHQCDHQPGHLSGTQRLLFARQVVAVTENCYACLYFPGGKHRNKHTYEIASFCLADGPFSPLLSAVSSSSSSLSSAEVFFSISCHRPFL